MHPEVDEATKASLREQLHRLDPVQLLQQIRDAQQRLAELEVRDGVRADPVATTSIDSFLASLSEAWKAGEVRPTHRKKPSGPRTWRTRVDPFEHVWPMIQQWLEAEPGSSAKALLHRLTAMLPDLYAGSAQLRTLQRRVQAWRREQAMNIVFRARVDCGSIGPIVAEAQEAVVRKLTP
jgi:hypothetical protein